jgi:hypothetical protein
MHSHTQPPMTCPITIQHMITLSHTHSHMNSSILTQLSEHNTTGKHDSDSNAALEWDEFIEYARGYKFLTAWFGDLSGDGGGVVSWKDAHLA